MVGRFRPYFRRFYRWRAWNSCKTRCRRLSCFCPVYRGTNRKRARKIDFWEIICFVHKIQESRSKIAGTEFCLLASLTENNPVSECSGGALSLRGDKKSYRNHNWDRKSIVSSSKIPVGMALKCSIFHSISNGDKTIGQFPSWCFFYPGRFLANFSSEAGALGCDTGV